MDKIDTNWSNDIFLERTPEEMSTQQFIWKLRNNCLYIPARQFMRYRTQPLDCVSSISRSILYPTPECEDCTISKPICDMNHMWTCPSNRIRVTKFEDDIISRLREIDPNEKIPLWTPETMASLANNQFKRSDIVRPIIRQRRTINTPNAPTNPIETNTTGKRKATSRDPHPSKRPKRTKTKSNYNPLTRMRPNTTEETRKTKKRKTLNKDTNKQQTKRKRKSTTSDGPRRTVEALTTTTNKNNTTQINKQLTQSRMSQFVTGSTRTPIIIDPIPQVAQEIITREHLLCNVLKITSMRNLKHRENMEKIWDETAIRQYRNHQKCKSEALQIKGRATQGWIPRETIKTIRKMAKALKCTNETIEHITRDIIRMTVKTSQDLYLKIIERNIRRRKIEGVSIKSVTNTKNDYKAMRIINSKLPDNG